MRPHPSPPRKAAWPVPTRQHRLRLSAQLRSHLIQALDLLASNFPYPAPRHPLYHRLIHAPCPIPTSPTMLAHASTAMWRRPPLSLQVLALPLLRLSNLVWSWPIRSNHLPLPHPSSPLNRLLSHPAACPWLRTATPLNTCAWVRIHPISQALTIWRAPDVEASVA